MVSNGQYNDNIRMVYEDLLCMGLSSCNVEKVIRVVLKQLAGVEVDRPSKATFAKYMLIEARGLAQIHVASELAGMSDCAPNTLHSNGTSKQGYSYTTFDANKSDGKHLV